MPDRKLGCIFWFCPPASEPYRPIQTKGKLVDVANFAANLTNRTM